MNDVILKVITTVVGILVTGFLTKLGFQIKKYKDLLKQEEDKTVKDTITNVLNAELEPIRKDIKFLKIGMDNIEDDVANLQTAETNFQTRLDPAQEEIEHLKDDITEILLSLKNQGIDLQNLKAKEEHLEEQTRCAWRYRIRMLCHYYIKRGYITDDEYNQLQEMMRLYEALGGNGQTRELYEKAIQLPIRSE